MSLFGGKISDFFRTIERQYPFSKYNCVKTFDVRHDVKHYRISQGITGLWKMQFFSIISFLNDLTFYAEEQNELS